MRKVAVVGSGYIGQKLTVYFGKRLKATGSNYV